MFRYHKTITSILLAVVLIATTISSMPAPVQAAPADDEPERVILTLREQAQLDTAAILQQPNRSARQEAVIQALKKSAAATQPAVMRRVRQLQANGAVKNVQPLWISNAVAVEGSAEAIAELSRLPEVQQVSEDYPLMLIDSTVIPDTEDLSTATLSLSQISVKPVWESGFTGAGIVVANIDTGVSLENADMAARWRGGSNSWYDVHGQHATPADVSGGNTGHGTNTMSIMVGSNIGVAPGAQWIAVKLFSDTGSATISQAIEGYQWLLDPDGNPATADGADVINSSWTFQSTGCVDDLALHQALQSMLAADVLPVFAGGNMGNGIRTDTSPGNYAEALAVGSIDADDSLSFFSSQGPNSCLPGATFPDLVAPGHSVTVQDPYGTLTTNSGTSFSAPHVAGALALLLDAFPNLSAEEQRQALIDSAYDLGPIGPDNAFGAGKLNVFIAFLKLGGAAPYRVNLFPIYKNAVP